MAHRHEAGFHLRSGAAEGHRPRRAHTHHLQADRDPHRAHFLRRAEHSEHTRANRAGARVPAVFRRKGGVCAGGRGLLADRASHTRPPVRRREHDRGVPERRGHSHRHRLAGVRSAGGVGDSRDAPQREGCQFRHRVRHRRVLALEGHRGFGGAGGRLHQVLPHEVQRG